MVERRLRSAVILAAGAGTRFWPYNVVRQKAAFPIANVPNVRRIVDNLIELGIEQIVVVVGAGEASVRAALHDTALEPLFVRQDRPDGTAAAALSGANAVEGDFMVVHGDVVSARANLQRVMTAWLDGDFPALALAQPLGSERPQDWIVAHVGDGVLTGVEGHPRSGTHRLGGVYVFSQSVLSYLRANPGVMHHVPVGGMPPLEAEIGESLQMMLDVRLPIGVVEPVGYHIDLDKPWHILAANAQVIDAMSDALEGSVVPEGSHIHDGAEIAGHVVLGENCTIGNRTVLRGDVWLGDGAQVLNGAIIDGPAIIGPGAVVRDYALIGGHTTVGPRGIYGHGAEFSGVALEKVYCYHYCEIWGVVGLAVDFGAATVCGNLRFDDADTTWRIKGRAETPNHAANAAYFGDYSRTGVNAIIMPGRRIGTYAVVGAGVVAYDDVPDRELVMVKQELVRRPWGPERYGW